MIKGIEKLTITSVVHCVAFVFAARSSLFVQPSNPFSSVDLPAFCLPTIAILYLAFKKSFVVDMYFVNLRRPHFANKIYDRIVNY